MQPFDPWQPLLEMARRTPSPHNVQLWRVALRSVTRAQDREFVKVSLHPLGTGPFAGRDTRIKNQYVAD